MLASESTLNPLPRHGQFVAVERAAHSAGGPEDICGAHLFFQLGQGQIQGLLHIFMVVHLDLGLFHKASVQERTVGQLFLSLGHGGRECQAGGRTAVPAVGFGQYF